jgi:transmembrane sensor
VILRAGDRGMLGRDGVAGARPGSAGGADVAWTNGQLVFDGTPIERAATELRRWYGIELRIADPSFTGRHITATFQGEATDKVLEVIGLVLGARIERQGDTAFVRRLPAAGTQ